MPDVKHRACFSISQVMGRPCNCDAGTCNASQKYSEELQETIDYMTSGNVAALIHEGILGVGGVVQYPKGFIKNAYEIGERILRKKRSQSTWSRLINISK